MPVHLVKSSLRVSAVAGDSYSPTGWVPKVGAVVMGPTPEFDLVLTVEAPGGGEWHEVRSSVDELAEEEGRYVELCAWGDAHEIADVGRCAFTLRAENEIEGVDEPLHRGAFTAVAAGGGGVDVGVPADWLLPLGLVAFDVHDDKDAPPLRVTVFLGGDVQTHELQAHLFRDGRKVAETDDVSRPWTATTTAGTPLASEVVFVFDTVRGWNNLREQDPTWRVDDLWLDVEHGDYEVRIARGKKVVRMIGFSIDGNGRLVTDGRIEPDVAARPTAWLVAAPSGDLDGVDVDVAALEQAAYGGDLATAAIAWSLDGMYWYRAAPTGDGGDGGDGADGGGSAAAPPALQALVDEATTLIRNWEDDLADDRADVDQCQIIIVPDCDRFEEQRAALDLPDHEPVTLLDEPTTLGELTARVLALRDRARAKLAAVQQAHEDALAPYRAVLRNDKLAIFEDYPADGFEYLTSDKKPIGTPEELAAAEYWYFEGVLDLDAEAEIDGERVKGTVRAGACSATASTTTTTRSRSSRSRAPGPPPRSARTSTTRRRSPRRRRAGTRPARPPRPR